MWYFITGGLAGMTATATVTNFFPLPAPITTRLQIQPLDMIKTRMQLKSEAKGKLSTLATIKDLYKNEGGIVAFYKGLGSALMRQVIYAALRLGMFYSVVDIAKDKWGKTLNAGEKAVVSLGSGAIAAFVATPFDLALIRFQADGSLPVDQRRNYKNWADALGKIIKSEGFYNLWKGALPTIVRAMAINLGMMAPYEECKQRFKKYFGEGYTTYISASFLAGLLAAFLGLPPDNIKTKIQKMKAGPDGKLPYKGFFDCVSKTYRNEGLPKFWVGFPIFYSRVGIHAMLILLVSDALKYLILGKK